MSDITKIMRRASGEDSAPEEWLPKGHPERVAWERGQESLKPMPEGAMTAKEAREVALQTSEKYLPEIFEQVRANAEKGLYELEFEKVVSSKIAQSLLDLGYRIQIKDNKTILRW